MKPSRTLVLLLALVAVLIVGGAAAVLSRKPAAQAGGEAVLRVGSQKGGTKALMLAAGVLDGAPYRIEWSEFPAAQHLLEALSAGAVDLGQVGDAPFLFAYASGSKIKAVQLVKSVSGGRGTAILVPKGSRLRSPADLKGKRIATGRGSIGHYLVLRALETNGLQPSDVTMVFLSPADAKAAFSTGAVDAWSTWTSYVGVAVLHDQARILVDGKGLLSGFGFEVATETAIRDKRPQVSDFLARLARAQRWSATHKPEYAAMLAKETGIPADVAAYTVERMAALAEPIDDTVAAEERVALAHYRKAGLAPEGVDPAGGLDASFNGSISP